MSIPVAVVECNPLIILIMPSLGAFLNVKVFGLGKLTLINSILRCHSNINSKTQHQFEISRKCHFHLLDQDF